MTHTPQLISQQPVHGIQLADTRVNQLHTLVHNFGGHQMFAHTALHMLH